MKQALDGLTILIPESRVQILDLEDTAEAGAWIDQLIRGTFKDVVWLTGEGLRRLLPIADKAGHRADFIAALGSVRTITRGPKPARALRELGLSAQLPALTPTSQGVLDVLAGEDIAGRSIGVQLYPGDGGLPLVAGLRARGAHIFPVTPYRYASETDTAQVTGMIGALIAGEIGMIAFTSSPQVERLVAVARGAGLETQLRDACARIDIAAIGPVVEETLLRHGIKATLRPDTSFHLKPLVRAIVAAWISR
jgi:uroporphyrinogen-III synthase